MAWKLLNEYGRTEEDVAVALGITQAAVRNYSKSIRGDRKIILRIASVRELMYMIDDITADLARSKVYTPYTMSKFIEIYNFQTFFIDHMSRSLLN